MEDQDQNPLKKTSQTPSIIRNGTLTQEILNSTKKKKDHLYILTYNVRTLSTYERLIELSEALTKIKYDIIGMCEIRRTGTRIEEYNNFILCHTGHTPGKRGVGFIINKTRKNWIKSFMGINDRVALLNLNIQGLSMSIIQIYAPTETACEEEINNFYTNVNRAVDQAYKNYIIMGDFNAKIGQPRKDEHLIMKPNGYGERNQRGQRLIDFALEHKLAILNTFFHKKPNQRWTWRSPNDKYKNEIDYVLSNQPNIFQNIEVLNLNYPSDHRAIRATMSITKQTKKRTAYKSNRYSSLKTEQEILSFKQNISSQLQDLYKAQEKTSVQALYSTLTKAITQSLQDARISNEISKGNHKVLKEYTLELIKRRQELQHTKIKTRDTKNELSALYKLISKHIKQDYKCYRLKTIEKHLEKAGSSKKALKELRINKSWIDSLNCKDKTVNNRKEIIDVATHFYKTLYKAQGNECTSHSYANDINSTNKSGDIAPITEKEVTQEIKKLKLEKSPGPDGITNEAIKVAWPLLTLPLLHLFNLILKTAEIPSQWAESEIILIYKKGDSKDITNYRPISLLSCIYKLFSSIINKRISVTIEANQPIEQAGFRKSFSTIDHIHTLEQIMEKYQEKQITLYIAYIDYKKAFDTVSHSSIWTALQAQKVEQKYIDIISNIYKSSTAKIKLESTGPTFSIGRGVKQGDPLSPKLFISLLESIIKRLNWEKTGLNINGKYLSHLCFADDLVLLSESSTQLQSMIDSLNTASKQVGLEMNLSKTMVMTNSLQRRISVDNETLKYTENYIYLGKQIGLNRKQNDLEIERRVQNTWNKYWSLKEIFKSNMPTNIKTKLMMQCLLPCLTYACQTWKFTCKLKSKITSCQRGIERSMLNIKKMQKIRHTKIREATKATDALIYAKKLKWKWAGHVARLKDERWTNRVTTWKGPIGKRRKGRPHMRWSDELIKIAGTRWPQIAQDKDIWYSLEEAFTFI